MSPSPMIIPQTPCLQGLDRAIVGQICLFLEKKDLAALAVTARAFRPEAERLLYHELSWSGGGREAHYRIWPLLNSDRPRASFVRSLSIRIRGNVQRAVEFALDECKKLTYLSLRCTGTLPTSAPRRLSRRLQSLDISWTFFSPEDLFRLLNEVPQLESLSVDGWPLDVTEDPLEHDALPALRSLRGSVSIVLALLPTRPTIASVEITSDYVGSTVIDTLAMHNLRHLEVMFETSTIELICTACPNLESVHFWDAVTEDLDAWVQGDYPAGWKKLTSLREFVVQFDLMAHEVISVDSPALLREQVKGIWPLLQPGGIVFYRQLVLSWPGDFIGSA